MRKVIEQMIDEIKLELSNGVDLDDIKDRSGEMVDGYLPVYTNNIIKEWQDMPSDYDNRGSAELGHNCNEISITNLMSLDLYLYYTDLFFEAITEVEDSLKVAQ